MLTDLKVVIQRILLLICILQVVAVNVAAKEANSINACNSFTGDTKISTKQGLKPIKDISLGDLVWSYDFEDRRAELKTVEELQRHDIEDEDLILLTVSGRTIETTIGHPFWVENKGWVEANDLHVGDKLYTKKDKFLAVQSLETNFVSTEVYNFEVADNHNYFVSKNFILVHNPCPPEPPADSQVTLSAESRALLGDARFEEGQAFAAAYNHPTQEIFLAPVYPGGVHVTEATMQAHPLHGQEFVIYNRGGTRIESQLVPHRYRNTMTYKRNGVDMVHNSTENLAIHAQVGFLAQIEQAGDYTSNIMGMPMNIPNAFPEAIGFTVVKEPGGGVRLYTVSGTMNTKFHPIQNLAPINHNLPNPRGDSRMVPNAWVPHLQNAFQ